MDDLLDPIEDHFKKLWAIYRPARRKEKMVCLAIYRKIVSEEGREHSIVRDGEKYAVHVRSTPEEIFEGCEAYLWKERDTDDKYILHLQRFLKYGTWEDMEDVIPEMKAYKLRTEQLKDRVSTSQLREILLKARMLLDSETKFGSAEGKKNSLKAVENAETALNDALGNG